MGRRDELNEDPEDPTKGDPVDGSQWSSIEKLAESFLERVRRGERPEIRSYVERYPDLAEKIQEVFPAMLMLERMGDSEAPETPAEDEDSRFINRAPRESLAATLSDEPRRQIGDYRILREIGRGGMGVVYEAIQESLDRRVALKILPPASLLSSDHRQRFHREAQSAARLHHSNIVPVFGVGEADGIHYYAMQFIRGQSLDKVIREIQALQNGQTKDPHPAENERDETIAGNLVSGRLRIESQPVEENAFPPKNRGPSSDGNDSSDVDRSRAERQSSHHRTSERPSSSSNLLSRDSKTGGQSSSHHHYFRSVASLGAQVASALAYAHGQGVLHRDIKPSNLLLDARGVVWVTDFGLAKAEGTDSLTQVGDVLGTVPYMAPERFRGWSDPRSDVYGLGLTIYELLTLRRAFQASNQPQLLKRIVEERPSPPRKINPHIPRDLETIVLKAIEKDPGKRYRSAKLVLSDLKLFLEGKPISARRSGALKRSWLWCRRNPSLATLVALALGLLLLVVFVSVRSAQKAEEKSKLLERQLYASNIRLSQNALEKGEVEVASQLLESAPLHHRGWEWNWLSREARSSPKTLRGHEGYVYGLALSPDGTRVVSGGNDRTIRLWDVETGELLISRRAHGGRFGVQAVAYDLKGEHIVSAGADHEIKIWKAESLEPVGVLRGHQHFVSTLSLSPVGNRLASGSFDGSVKVWDLDTKTEWKSWPAHDDIIYGVSVSPDGKRILSSSHDTKIKLWDLSSGECLYTAAGHTDGVHGISFSPDGQTFASTSLDHTVKLWDAQTGSELFTLDSHSAAVLNVSFSHDGRTLATVGMDEKTLLWDLETRKVIQSLEGHRNVVRWAIFGPDDSTVLTCAQDGLIKLWDRAPEPRTVSLHGIHRVDVRVGAFSPSGEIVATADSEGQLALWNPETGRIRKRFTGSGKEIVWSVAFRPDGKQVASGSQDGLVRLWDVDSGEETHRLDARKSTPWAGEEAPLFVAYVPRGEHVISGGFDGMIRVWESDSGKLVRTFLAHEGSIWTITVSPDGERILSGGDDRLLRLWDEMGNARGTMSGHRDKVLSATFSPDGKTILSGSKDSLLILWNTESGQRIRTLSGHSGWIWSTAFSPSGRRIASGGSDGALKLWDAALGQELLTLRKADQWIVHVSFSPDGTRILSCPSWISEGNRLGSASFEKTPDNQSMPTLWNGSPPR